MLNLVQPPPTQDNLASDRVIVDTVHGPVIGKLEEDYDVRFRKKIYWKSFTGVPFAAPPVDRLRFQPPQPPAPWTCPLDATKENMNMRYLLFSDSKPFSDNSCSSLCCREGTRSALN